MKRDLHLQTQTKIFVKMIDFVKKDDNGNIIVQRDELYYERPDGKEYTFSSNKLDGHAFTTDDKSDLHTLLDYMIYNYILNDKVEAILVLDVEYGYDPDGYVLVEDINQKIKNTYITYKDAQTPDAIVK